MKSYSLMHCHSHFSLLDGYGYPKDNAKVAKDLGMNAIGISDHGNCFVKRMVSNAFSVMNYIYLIILHILKTKQTDMLRTWLCLLRIKMVGRI